MRLVHVPLLTGNLAAIDTRTMPWLLIDSTRLPPRVRTIQPCRVQMPRADNFIITLFFNRLGYMFVGADNSAPLRHAYGPLPDRTFHQEFTVALYIAVIVESSTAADGILDHGCVVGGRVLMYLVHFLAGALHRIDVFLVHLWKLLEK